MILCRIRSELERALSGGGHRALVPTMGGLHAGHLSLIQQAREQADTVWATLFVNRCQFDDPQDYQRYPREEKRDLEQLEAAGVDLVYAPQEQEIWGDESPQLEAFSVIGLTDILEGAHRGSHLCAVAAVVTHLFDHTQPQSAVFGEKDYQQLVLVRHLAALRQPPIEIIAVPVVREADGLAMSSRNRHLDATARARAGLFYQSLQSAAESLQQQGTAQVAQQQARDCLQSSGFQVDYVAIRDPDTLQEVGVSPTRFVILAAVRLGSVRLLDCLLVK